MTQEQQSLIETFYTLSSDQQKLLISMCTFSRVGGKLDLVKVTSGFAEDKLKTLIEELKSRSLLEQGENINGNFVANDQGSRYRLPEGVKDEIKTKILKLKP